MTYVRPAVTSWDAGHGRPVRRTVVPALT